MKPCFESEYRKESKFGDSGYWQQDSSNDVMIHFCNCKVVLPIILHFNEANLFALNFYCVSHYPIADIRAPCITYIDL